MSDIDNQRDAAWRAANHHAYSVIDENSRHTIAGMTAQMVGGLLPDWQLAKLQAYWAWWEAVWTEYARVRAQVLRGIPTVYDPAVAGPCPGDIWWLRTAPPADPQN